MKKKSRLAVLLAVVLLSAIVLSGAVFAETVREMPFSAGEVLTLRSAENVEATKVYMQLMECTTLVDVFNTMMLEENRTGMYALNEAQLNGLYQFIRDMYVAIAEPTEDETEYYDLLVETLIVLAEGNGFELNLLADGDTIFLDIGEDDIYIYDSPVSGGTYVKYGEAPVQSATNNDPSTGWIKYDANKQFVIKGSNTSASGNKVYIGWIKNPNPTAGNPEVESRPIVHNCIIYLDNVKIGSQVKANENDGKAAICVDVKSGSSVTLVLKDKTNNVLYGGDRRAAIEKYSDEDSYSQGELIITCETALNSSGHNCSESGSCGKLSATGGGNTFSGGAGIGTRGGQGESEVMKNTLTNLKIKGGVITAKGATGDASESWIAAGGSGGGAGIGTGSSSSSTVSAGTAHIEISGGYIEAEGGDASAAGVGGGYRSGTATVDITGGTIIANKVLYNNIVEKSGIPYPLRAAAIGGGGGGTLSAAPSTGNVTISGSNTRVTAYGRYGAAIGGGAGGDTGNGNDGTVTINGGTITAVSDVSGAAIGSGGSLGSGAGGEGKVTINGGTITATTKGTGAAIGSAAGTTSGSGGNSTVIIGGGFITTDGDGSGAGIGAGAGGTAGGFGGKTNITINNGVVIATSIGGGPSRYSTNKGGDATLTVTGGNLTVKQSIGGGGTVTGTGGQAEVKVSGSETKIRTQSIGGGVPTDPSGKIGPAKVTISDGNIVAQVLMEGTGSTFNMSGGQIDNSDTNVQAIASSDERVPKDFEFELTKEHGGAVYIQTGEAEMTGGTIQNCVAETNGGALYVAGGSFKMTGGTIAECRADSGGAVYVTGGNVTMTSGVMNGNEATNDGGAVYVTGGDVTIGDQNCTGTTHVHPELQNNTAANGGAIAVENRTPIMYCGTMTGNTAFANGGAVYVNGGGFTMNNGTIDGGDKLVNAVNGGAVYLSGGTFTMDDGSITSNTATSNGGAAYVANGSFTMNGGTMSSNTAPNGNGGAAYVSGGNFTMMGGTLGGSGAGNSALNGGAVYVTGGNFTMISGEMSYNTATAQNNTEAEAGRQGYGGAVYAAASGGTGGAVVVGVKDCTGVNEGSKHSVTYTDLAHPIVTHNNAAFGGGFAVNGGSVAFYCGKVVDNETTGGDGTGMNVFMKDGTIVHYMAEAVIGKDDNHGMVSTGGKLEVWVKNEDEQEHKYFKVQLIYNANIEDPDEASIDVEWEGEIPNGYYLNLPYCPTEWQNWQNTQHKLTFVGWTETPDKIQSKTIRSKDDYNPIGKAVEIHDTTIGDEEKIMRFYAVWAPAKSNIQYAYVTDDETIQRDWTHEGAKEYSYTTIPADVSLGNPLMPGYAFQKWILYAEYGRDLNAEGINSKQVNISNWNSDASTSPQDPTKLEHLAGCQEITGNTLSTLQNFGDIVLVAVFEPEFADLTITKTGELSALDNPSFIFHVKATNLLDSNLVEADYELDVVIDGTGSVTIQDLPVGTYTVTEQENWSWRYSADDAIRSVTLIDPANAQIVTFKNDRTETKWLDGEDYGKNKFNSNSN